MDQQCAVQFEVNLECFLGKSKEMFRQLQRTVCLPSRMGQSIPSMNLWRLQCAPSSSTASCSVDSCSLLRCMAEILVSINNI